MDVIGFWTHFSFASWGIMRIFSNNFKKMKVIRIRSDCVYGKWQYKIASIKIIRQSNIIWGGGGGVIIGKTTVMYKDKNKGNKTIAKSSTPYQIYTHLLFRNINLKVCHLIGGKKSIHGHKHSQEDQWSNMGVITSQLTGSLTFWSAACSR